MNNRDTVDLRRHHAHYDVTVMKGDHLMSIMLARTTVYVCVVALTRQRFSYNVVAVLGNSKHMVIFPIFVTQRLFTARPSNIRRCIDIFKDVHCKIGMIDNFDMFSKPCTVDVHFL